MNLKTAQQNTNCTGPSDSQTGGQNSSSQNNKSEENNQENERVAKNKHRNIEESNNFQSENFQSSQDYASNFRRNSGRPNLAPVGNYCFTSGLNLSQNSQQKHFNIYPQQTPGYPPSMYTPVVFFTPSCMFVPVVHPVQQQPYLMDYQRTATAPPQPQGNFIQRMNFVQPMMNVSMNGNGFRNSNCDGVRNEGNDEMK